MSTDDRDAEIAALRAESNRLRAENACLKSLLEAPGDEPRRSQCQSPPAATPVATQLAPSSTDASVTANSPAAAKVALFRMLFCGREDVFAVRRQGQGGRSVATFLDLPPNVIGMIGGGRARPTGAIDVAVIQSLNKKGMVADLVADYGHVIVDECHHLSAFSFEQVMRQVKARYVAGLTATPERRDGHHPIITMQCGPIRYRVDAKSQAAARPFNRRVVRKRTEFAMPAADVATGIQVIYSALAADPGRERLIVADVLAAVTTGRSPLVLTERTDHRDRLAATLSESIAHVFVMSGGMGIKKRRAIAEAMAATPATAPRVVVATGRCVGEGFDDARLDTLFLAMPVAWRGTLQQYAGRLHRVHAGKSDVVIYDYVDDGVPVLARMHQKRLAGYRAMGYGLEDEPGYVEPLSL